MAIKVGVVGAKGKMGQEVLKALEQADDMEILFGVDPSAEDGESFQGAAFYPSIEAALALHKPDAVVDFTFAEVFRENAPKVLEKGLPLITGTTGLEHSELEALGKLAKEKDTTFFYAANFAIGAVLMMHFAAQAVKYMPDVEVIERHHDAKKDAPSGTAIATLKAMAESRVAHIQGYEGEEETIPHARGGDYEGMKVHSMRLPGYNAHQEVVFGGLGQSLTIRHDSINRSSFMPGVLLALRESLEHKGLVEGLDRLMNLS